VSSGPLIALRRVATRRIAPLAFALLSSALLVTPAFGAPQALGAADVPTVVREDPPDATDGGYTPTVRRSIFPSIEIGLTQQRPIPLGVTCACTIDRVGLVSQFDITVIRVVPDAANMFQQMNRFNRPPRPGARYMAAYVGQLYVAGPTNQAYTATESDWKATTTDQRLSDVAQLLHDEPEYRLRADVYPADYVNGWLLFELPVNRPAFLVWNYNFVGERGIWFALQ
jgi:hypothetical protein